MPLHKSHTVIHPVKLSHQQTQHQTENYLKLKIDIKGCIPLQFQYFIKYIQALIEMSIIPQIEPNNCSAAVSNLQDQFSELIKDIEMIKSAKKELKSRIEKLNNKHSQHIITIQRYQKRAKWLSENYNHQKHSSPSTITKRETHSQMQTENGNQTKQLGNLLHIWKWNRCNFLVKLAWLTLRFWYFYCPQQ